MAQMVKHLPTMWETQVQTVYCYPVYLAYMQSASCKMTGWISCKLESRLPREISNLRYMDDTTLMAESKEKLDQIRSDQSLSHVRLFVTP